MLIVSTASGSVYRFDQAGMTWARYNEKRDIVGMESINEGTLDIFPIPVVGESMRLLCDGFWVHTTPVVSIESEDDA